MSVEIVNQPFPHFTDDSGEEYGLLPGNLSPVLREDAVGLSWSLNF